MLRRLCFVLSVLWAAVVAFAMGQSPDRLRDYGYWIIGAGPLIGGLILPAFGRYILYGRLRRRYF